MYDFDYILVIVVCTWGSDFHVQQANYWIGLPHFVTSIGLGCHIAAQLWYRIAIFLQAKYLGLGSERGPIMYDN